MGTGKRFTVTTVAGMLLAVLVAGPAFAAPPTNDTFGGATLVSIGFSEVLDDGGDNRRR